MVVWIVRCPTRRGIPANGRDRDGSGARPGFKRADEGEGGTSNKTMNCGRVVRPESRKVKVFRQNRRIPAPGDAAITPGRPLSFRSCCQYFPWGVWFVESAPHITYPSLFHAFAPFFSIASNSFSSICSTFLKLKQAFPFRLLSMVGATSIKSFWW